MSTVEEKKNALKGVVDSLNVSKFGVPEVSIADIIASPNKYVLVDTRTTDERAVSTIPSSISKETYELQKDMYTDKEIVCFCTVGYLSGGYAAQCRKNGQLNVMNMGDGALLGYALAGNSLVDADGSETKSVHTFMDGLSGLGKLKNKL